MARPLRLAYAGGVYHITARGNAQQAIVQDDVDRACFVTTLAHMVEQYRVLCHAWVLKPNHYHLLLETPTPNLSLALRHLNGVYSQAYNRRHHLVGHVFQGRFKAMVVEKEAYLLELCRYIVLNPVRAKLVPHPRHWRWSSYRATAGEAAVPSWLMVGWVLEQFGSRMKDAHQSYRLFVREGLSGNQSPWDELVGQVYLGSPRFIECLSVVKSGGEDREIPQIQRQPLWMLPEEVLNSIARGYGVELPTLLAPTRRPSEARQLAVWGLRRKAGLKLEVIGQRLGLGYTAVSRGIGRVAQRLEQDRAFARRVNYIFEGKVKT